MRFETHAHSHYSSIRLIDSICKPKDMILTAAEMGYAGVTLTDHEALCGHIEWLELEKELKEKGKIPEDFVCALGNEIYLTDTREPKQKYFHFLLIAKNTEGHRALRELSSTAWLNSYSYRGMERVPTLKSELREIVRKYPNSLIADNACLGSQLDGLVLSLVEAEKKNDLITVFELKREIDEFMQFCIELFGDDFYIELAPGTSKDQKTFNKRIKPIADSYKRKIVIGCDAHYLTAKDREIHKAFLNSKDGEREVDSFYYDAHFMTDEEAYENLKDIFSEREFQEFCENSLELMRKIGKYEIFHQPIIPEVQIFPAGAVEVPFLESYPSLYLLCKSENPQEREWVFKCLKALKEKNLVNETYLDRLNLEAEIILHIGNVMDNCLFSYFNTYCHYTDLFWECGSVIGPGRGSAGSFLSNFLLGITQLDPIIWDFPYFRFLNKDRAELPDIDVDLSPSKRPLILRKIREERGELNVAQVATFGTTSSKAAIATACRGYRSENYPKGIDVDEALFLSSLIPVERGIQWSLNDCFYGNEEKNRKPIKELVRAFENYPGLKEICLGIEGLVVRRGQHASGVILYNDSPYETGALMRSPNGDVTTQYDLHRAETAGDVKFDFLVTDVCDKIATTLELLKKNGYFSQETNLRDIYNKVLHPDVIDLNDQKLWKALESGEVQDVFQFNTPIGIQTAQAIQPKNPIEMTAANALLRLVAPEGQERPFDRYIRFKKDISLWYEEMDNFGLTKDEQKVLEPYYLKDYGVPCNQEALMLMVMDKDISHFTLAESNKTRKVLAKKRVEEIPVIKEKFINQCPTKTLGEYCWMTMMLPQMSYSFSMVHSTLYTFIGIQTLVLATKFPVIYWNTACLIVNSQSLEEELEEKEVEEDDDEEETEKKKKKQKTVNYGKVSSAIGKIKEKGVVVSPPDINQSGFTFSPDEKNNIIRFGLRGITKVGEEIVHEIIANRPYASLDDFLSKVKLNKTQMVNLIKSGAFDSFGDRAEILQEYIYKISDVKKRITLQNMKMLIDFGLIPDEYDLDRRIFNFNKYLKKMKLNEYYGLDNIAFSFFEKHFSVDLLAPGDTESGFMILQTQWDKLYKKSQDHIRPYIQKNSKELLEAVNHQLTKEVWDKYCGGTISQWEMESVSCYFHPHELEGVIGFSDFFELSENPEIDRIMTIKGKQIPLFKIHRICGTVLDRDKLKKTVTLLTTSGVVNVRIFGDVFSYYDKQISERGADGTKHVIEKSVFSRGNKIAICGIRRGNDFCAKKYKSTPFHLIETIEEICPNGAVITKGRTE